ncbi:MAG TPA: hypothetical protein VFE20_01395 [Thermoleophilia bacterium]|nr:hypothetical protein [Thermoleophilia bacterium]
MTIAKSKALWPAILLAALLAMLILSVAPAAAAAPDVVGPGDGSVPFLCPSAGEGQGIAKNQDTAGTVADGRQTFLPGNNQAGAHANPNGFNAYAAVDSPAPGNGNNEWSPIWPSQK